MGRKLLGVSILIVLICLFVLPTTASAHQTVQIGDYAVEYGWENEPVIANQPNAVVINLTGKGGDTNIDVSNLQIQAVFGSETKQLTLQPLGENTPGQFVASMMPTRPGTYTFHLSGTVGTTSFNNDVQPEEVHTSDFVAFPLAGSSAATVGAGLGLAGWLGIAGILLGLVGTALGAAALNRKK